jgi:hypothetical protein
MEMDRAAEAGGDRGWWSSGARAQPQSGYTFARERYGALVSGMDYYL